MLDDLEALYTARLAEFRRVAAAIVGDRDLGRDVVQEAFASAVAKRRSFRGDAPLEAWVWRIVINAARDARRRQTTDTPAITEQLASTEATQRVPLELLTARQREVVFLRYYADLDYGAIAAALAISPGTVGATLNSAHNTLRQALQEVRP